MRRLYSVFQVVARPATVLAMSLSLYASVVAQEVRHPTSQNIPANATAIITDDSVPSGIVSPAERAPWLSVRHLLLNASPVVTLGQSGLERSDSLVFGLIADVEIDSAGGFVVLDRGSHRVIFFDSAGGLIESFGRAGEGPTEFRDPMGLALLPGGDIGVADRGNQMKIFARLDSGVALLRNIRLPLVPEGMCNTSASIFVSGWKSDNTVIHQVPIASDTLYTSFGSGYADASWLVRQQLSDGRVACVNPSHIVFAFEYFPIVTAYAATDGRRLWTAKIDDYAQTIITSGIDRSDGAPYVAFDNQPSEIMATSLGVGQDFVLLQSIVDDRDPSSVRTYLVDVHTGQGARISTELPLIMALRGDRYVAVWDDPFPRLELRRLLTDSSR